MIVPELDELFDFGGRIFSGIFTDFDAKGIAGDSGLTTHVTRLLLEDDVANLLQEGALITRIKTGRIYSVKTKTRSGVGLTEVELNLGPDVQRYFERQL